MRIEPHEQLPKRAHRFCEEISEAANSHGIDGRVCRQCTLICPQCGVIGSGSVGRLRELLMGGARQGLVHAEVSVLMAHC